MIAALIGWAWPYLLAAAGWATAGWAVYRSMQARSDARAAKAQTRKSEDMRHANAAVDRDPAAVADRLRRGQF